MRLLRRWFVVLPAAVLAAGALPAVAPLAPSILPAAFAVDATDDLLAKFDELLKGGDDGKIIAFMLDLESKPDPRVTAKLVEVAKSHKVDTVAIAAMRQAAGIRKSPELLKWLKTKIDDDKYLEKHPDRYKAVLQSVAKYGDKSTLKPLEDVVKKYLGTNAELAALSIEAYGSVREKAVVEQMIKWVVQTENTSAGQGGKNASEATRNAYSASKAALVKALEELTMQAIGDGKTWQEWWDANGKTFKFPDPNAPEVDVTKLTEFTDSAYGWTLKKPDDPMWKFERQKEDGHRVELNFRDDKNMHWGRIRAFVWKAFSDAPTAETKVQAMVKLWEPKDDGKAEFSKFADGGAPKVEKKTIGGKEFWVGTARGLADGSWKAWEGCERRIYVHQLNASLLLYFDVVVRSGAEDPVKKALFGAMEGVTFKK